MEYLELKIELDAEVGELLIAELASSGFESFEESHRTLKAYVPADRYDQEATFDILRKYKINLYSIKTIGEENWNKIWESSFQPIDVEGRCRVRASFHPPVPGYEYDIILNPQMSFGTGHHQTTYLMIQWLLANVAKDKKVLDAGCGTGILSVLATLQIARKVDAIDIDEWACRNARENTALNNIEGITVHQGSITVIPVTEKYDLILANIEKNVLLQEMDEYYARLTKGSQIVMSGFFVDDIPELERAAGKKGLILEEALTKDNWACCSFTAG